MENRSDQDAPMFLTYFEMPETTVNSGSVQDHNTCKQVDLKQVIYKHRYLVSELMLLTIFNV